MPVTYDPHHAWPGQQARNLGVVLWTIEPKSNGHSGCLFGCPQNYTTHQKRKPFAAKKRKRRNSEPPISANMAQFLPGVWLLCVRRAARKACSRLPVLGSKHLAVENEPKRTGSGNNKCLNVLICFLGPLGTPELARTDRACENCRSLRGTLAPSLKRKRKPALRETWGFVKMSTLFGP